MIVSSFVTVPVLKIFAAMASIAIKLLGASSIPRYMLGNVDREDRSASKGKIVRQFSATCWHVMARNLGIAGQRSLTLFS